MISMIMALLLRVIFPPPPSFVINAISVIFFILLAILGFLEKTGKMHLQYSKFWNTTTRKSAVTQKVKLPSTIGMLFLYVPAFLAAFISLVLFPLEGIRILLLCSALALHFFKRIFEVLFVHKYSGGMILDSVILITFTYFSVTASMIYVQHLTQGFPEPEIDLKYLGLVLFLIGITGNFYHHILLSHLRKKGEKEYKIPKGGLFGLVICPHYLFEMIGFVGFFLISQTPHAFCIAIGISFYLMGRSYATRRWYISKFENFPKDVKALIPSVL